MARAEVSEVVSLNGQPSMRLMRPFRIDPSCLACHEEQGYKVGDIRGGISVSVPMDPIMAKTVHTWSLILGHVVLWMLGVVGIVLAGRRISPEHHRSPGGPGSRGRRHHGGPDR